MSQTNEEGGGSARVTRAKLRLMASNESLTDIDSQNDTPAIVRGRVNKQLETINENGSQAPSTPAKITRRASLHTESPAPRRALKVSTSEDTITASPMRRTRGISQETDIVSSPLRTTRARGISQDKEIISSPRQTRTRGVSQDKEIISSPRPIRVAGRATRRSSLAIEQDDISVDAETTSSTLAQSIKKKRQTLNQSIKYEPVLEEEQEVNGLDDLELRSRSVSKSPNTKDKTCVTPQICDEVNAKNNTSADAVEDQINASGNELKEDKSPVKVTPSKINKLNLSQTPINEVASRDTTKNDETENTVKILRNVSVSSKKNRLSLPPVLHPVSHVEADDLSKSFSVSSQASRELKPISSLKYLPSSDSDDDEKLEIADSDSESSVSDKLATEKQVDNGVEMESTSPKKLSKMTPSRKSASKQTESPIMSPLKTPSKMTPARKSATPSKQAESPTKHAATGKQSISMSEIDSSGKKKSARPTEENHVAEPSTFNEILGDRLCEEIIQDQETILQDESAEFNGTISEVETITKSTSADLRNEDEMTENDFIDIAKTATGEDVLNSSKKSSKKECSKYPKETYKGAEDMDIDNNDVGSDMEITLNTSSRSNSKPVSSRRSWSQAVGHVINDPIDNFPKNEEQETCTQSPVSLKKKSFVPSSDESDDENEENNSFIADECEVGSEESITESELKYVEENEVPDDGASIGSQDTNELEEMGDEEEEEENDSMIDDADLSDRYSMSSDEECIEEITEKPKRKSRIILQSSSSEDDAPAENRSVQNDGGPNRKRLREEDGELNASIAEMTSSKRIKANENIQAESENTEISTPENNKMVSAENTKVISEDLDLATTETPATTLKTEITAKSEQNKNQPKKEIDISNVLNKCEEYLSMKEQERKAKLPLKKAKKAEKLAKKQEALKAASSENFGNDENKENSLKKKKKKPSKKQKLVEDIPENHKDDMAEAITKIQEKLERKRLRKLEKKLAKAQRQQEAEPTLTTTVQEIAEAPKKKSKTKKKKTISDDPDLAQAALSDGKSKNMKEKSADSEVNEDQPVKEKKKKKTHVVTDDTADSVVKKTKKENRSDQNVDEPLDTLKETVPKKSVSLEPIDSAKTFKKNKLSNKTVIAESENIVECIPKKSKNDKLSEPQGKSKKRKHEETLDHASEDDAHMEMPKAKKKLSVLKQIEDPSQIHQVAGSSNGKKIPDYNFTTTSSKLKKLFPANLGEVAVKKRKKNKQRKIIPEPKLAPPKPVWTSTGYFIEETISPYSFTSTQYVPISSTGSDIATKFLVASVEEKKKNRLAPQQPMDFKTQAMLRNAKNRDGSTKNIKKLMSRR